MSIATELAKLQTARNKIRTKLVALGLVTAVAKLDDCATAVDGISNQGAVSATVQEGDTYTIPAGYPPWSNDPHRGYDTNKLFLLTHRRRGHR